MGLPSVWNNDVGQASLNGGGGSAPPEMYIPLWWWSGNIMSITANGTFYVQKGNSPVTSIGAVSAFQLYTVNANWKSSTKFAFEITGWSNATCSASLYDLTSSSIVSGSTISITATTATIYRSGQFTLIPGRAYGIQVVSGSAQADYLDASLIVFPS